MRFRSPVLHDRRARRQRGNILFLILLAVVLFAALSYAVTQSMRGGGKDSSDEKNQLAASAILNQITLWRGSYERLRVSGDVRQIQFNTSARSATGTCYEGSVATTSCPTIGLFNDPALTKPHSEKDWFADAYKAFTYHFVWINAQVTRDGTANFGTSKADIFIQLQYVTPELCRAINKLTQRQDAIFPSNGTTGRQGRMYEVFYEDTLTGSGFAPDTYGIYDFAYEDGCYDQNGVYVANFMLDEN